MVSKDKLFHISFVFYILTLLFLCSMIVGCVPTIISGPLAIMSLIIGAICYNFSSLD